MFWLKNAGLRHFGSMIGIQPFSGVLQELKLPGVIVCGIAHELRKGQTFRIGR